MPSPEKFPALPGQVCQGMMMAAHDNTKSSLINLWKHEMTRVYGDRLTSQSEKHEMQDLLQRSSTW